ncbi:MAG: hypothetical protein M3297_14315 [Thermoproteota archaeon]|nr:hypothetical protein [Thermoproteota archaeon]
MTPDEISALISEVKSRDIRSEEKLFNFLAEKRLTFGGTINFLESLLHHDSEYIDIIYSWLQRNLKISIEEYSLEFISIMETISKRIPAYISGLLLSLPGLDLDINHLMNIYEKTSNSESQELKISSGLILGEIGVVKPKVLLSEFCTIFKQSDELKKAAFLKAILVSYNKYKRTNFILTDDIKSAIIKCTKSLNTRLASEATRLCVILFERDPMFKGALQEYFNQSSEHRREIYQYIQHNDLKDKDFELSLLHTSLNTNVHDEVALAQWVIETKLLRSSEPDNNNLDKRVLQKFALDYVQELCKRKDMGLSLLSEGLLTQIGDANIMIASDYLLAWIGTDTSNGQTDPFLHPTVISNIFKNHERELFEFLQKLVGKDDKKFDILVCKTTNEIVAEAKRKFRSELKIHNNSTIRKLEKLINDEKRLSEIKPIESKDLDKFPDVLAKYIKTVNEQRESGTSTEHNASSSHMISDLESRRERLTRKFELLNNVLNLLINMSQKYDINYEGITEGFQGHKIDSIVMRCQILTSELLTIRRQESINYEDFERKLPSFPNIERILGHKWLKEKCREGHPYHLLVLWLSRLVDKDQLDQLILDCKTENDENHSYVKIEKLKTALRPLVWLRHVDTCLGYFTKENAKGKKAIISHLKDRRHFLQTLSQLEVALKLKQCGYKVDLENKSINPQIPMDILASKDDLTLICELATFDMYSHLKYSNFASEIPDRAESVMLQKIEQVSKYANKTSGLIILIFNLTHAPDIDLHGVQYSFQGSEVEHMVMDEKSKVVNRFTKVKRNPDFVNWPKAGLVSALFYYKNEVEGLEMKRIGDCILNLSADKKLDKNTLNNLKMALFS